MRRIARPSAPGHTEHPSKAKIIKQAEIKEWQCIHFHGNGIQATSASAGISRRISGYVLAADAQRAGSVSETAGKRSTVTPWRWVSVVKTCRSWCSLTKLMSIISGEHGPSGERSVLNSLRLLERPSSSSSCCSRILIAPTIVLSSSMFSKREASCEDGPFFLGERCCPIAGGHFAHIGRGNH